mgnify:CR=1 FL=1
MRTLADGRYLTAANTPWSLWGLLERGLSEADWERAVQEARGCLESLPAATLSDAAGIVGSLLSEEQFGPDRWRLGTGGRAYYALRRVIPRPARILLQRRMAARAWKGALLRWPVEDRYVRFVAEVVCRLCERRELRSVPYVHYWPGGRRFALVLTHDVETPEGMHFVPTLADLEERYGFCSSFNFVPEGYEVDVALLADLRRRGFEVGVHGLRHDGRLFASREVFEKRAVSINRYLRAWQAVGFRAPMTHRNPYWMQSLEIEYDSSFFDTDPFEPMPGGTMSIWPFIMGRFVELPYTLAQDHTLLRVLGQATPELWLRKVDFLREHCGMALIDTHPDYLRSPEHLAVYERLLAEVRRRGDFWHALPAEVARWWRTRMSWIAKAAGHTGEAAAPGGATIGRITVADGISGAGRLVLEPAYYVS